jgi:nucleotide-binding universal stress UspA family protein
MFREILVPLDGSKLSESSLEAAAALAEHFESSLVLLHVIEQNPPAEVHHERHLKTAQEARVYLERLAATAFRPGIRVKAHVHDPCPVSHRIAESAIAEWADLM